MGDIFNRLPFELICTIFVLVGQQACLESMRVCQKWFDQVPRHSTGVWKQVDFYYVWTKTNPCLIQCLGPHVQDVDVAYDRLDLLVRILKNRQCTISSLTIRPGDTIPSTADIVSGLQNASGHLTRLVLQDVSNDISPLSVARLCPRLTALSISLDKLTLRKQQHERQIQQQQRLLETLNATNAPDSSPEEPVTQVTTSSTADKLSTTAKEKSQPPCLSDLVHLQLDTAYDFNTHIEPLLRHCPRLQTLELSAFIDFRVFCIPASIAQTDFDFCRVLDLCPSIESLGYNAIFRLDNNNNNNNNNNNDSSSTKRRMISINNNNSSSDTSDHGCSGSKGLREFKFTSDRSQQSRRVMAVLEKASSTLQVLSLRRIPYNESGGWFDFKKIKKLQRLAKLTVAGRAIDTDVLVDFLCAHASTLEQLHLTSSDISESVLQVVSSKMLCLKHLSVSAESSEPFPRVIPRRHPHHRERQQQSLTRRNEQQPQSIHQQQNRLHTRTSRRLLHRTRSFIEFPVPSIPQNFHLLTQLPAIQEIDLSGMRLSDAAIQSLGSIQSLQSLWLADSGKNPDNAVTRDGLLVFASILSSNKNALRHLALGYFPSMDDTVMAAFGEIRSLRSLCITSCAGVTDTGLENFLDTAPLSTCFTVIRIYHCKRLTESGVQYAYNKLGRANVSYWHSL